MAPMNLPSREPPRPGFPPSPCIDVCKLDGKDVCTGCKRTIAEIAAWSRMTSDEQWQVIAALQKRQV
jgi:predicted Fe-S protein YdhL (DUF1289 family)